MSPLVVLHVTRVACRDSIRARGLLPSSPQRGRPFGVYVYADGIRNRRSSRNTTNDGTPRKWDNRLGQDVWEVSYIGPIVADVYMSNAIVLLDSVPPEYVTLVTRNSR